MLKQAVIAGVTGNTAVLNALDNVFPVKTFDTQVASRNDEQEKTQDHGLWMTYDYLSKRTYSFEGDVLGTTTYVYSQYRQNLLAALMPAPELGFRYTCILQLTLDGFSEDIYSLCNLDGLPDIPLTNEAPAVSQYQLNLKAADPILYGVTTNVVELGQPNTTSGILLPMAVPFSLSGISNNTAMINPAGNAPTYCVWTVTGPCSSPFLENTVNGITKRFALPNLQLPAGSSVTIDFGAKTVLSGTTSLKYYMDPTSAWWRLYPTNNNVVFGAYSADVGANSQLTYQSGYAI